MARKLNNEQAKQQISAFKKILLEHNKDLVDYERYNTGQTLYHKLSILPRKLHLYVSINPKIESFVVGIKVFTNSKKEQFKQTYENLPFDQKGSYTEALKYINIDTHIKYDNVPDADTLVLIDKALEFYKNNFSNFLN